MTKRTECGFDNPPERPYCSGLNTKRNPDRTSRDYFSGTQETDLRWKIRFIPAFFILVSLAMALCPDRIEPPKASDAESEMARGKIAMLQQGASAGPVEFSEGEVNLMFNNMLGESNRLAAGSKQIAPVSAGRIMIRTGSMIIHASSQIGPYHLVGLTFGPYWITYKVIGVPKRTAWGLRFSARGGSIGYFPFLGQYPAMMQLKKLFQPFKNARDFLENLKIVEIKNGSIKVAYDKII